jgi:tetratricopeptide (TPR) repeat protein
VNLGILYRKTGRLEQSEEALKTAVEHNDGSAGAWTELGATQRLRGEFPSAAASYEKAIAADPNFAPAYRNLGVVSDLYLGDPERALTAFERYKELTGEEKPVSGWIAELRQRTGKPPLKRRHPAHRARRLAQRRPVRQRHPVRLMRRPAQQVLGPVHLARQLPDLRRRQRLRRSRVPRSPATPRSRGAANRPQPLLRRKRETDNV